MKILNAKGLMRYASAGGFPDKDGYLLKRGDLNKGFQRRWFILRGNLLFYYEKRGDKEPAGMIILEGCAIEVAECEQVDNFAFQISFPSPTTRKYILSADSQEEMESWMKALSCAPYDYVKLLTAELDNQLKDTVCVDNAKLVQDAERDSRLFSRTYSRDCGEGHPLMPRSSPAESDSSNPYEDATGLWTNISHNPLDPFGDGASSTSVSMCFNINTWQMLRISSFYEMHEEIRRQIREFSAGHDQTNGT